MTPERHSQPGYFAIVSADGEEIPESRRPVPAGKNRERDERIIVELRAGMGPGCYVVFRAD